MLKHAFIQQEKSPIGIFDSGIGGLSVLKKIRTILPNENLIYYADSFYAPYGEKTNRFIEKRGISIAKWLANEKSCKAIVIACNTASAYITEKLRTSLPIPIIAIEPGIKPAVHLSKKKIIGVLATQATIRSKRYLSLINRYKEDCKVISLAANNLVLLVEDGKVKSKSALNEVKQFCDYFLEIGVDSIVLGCTHYSFLKQSFIDSTNRDVSIIDTSEAIANYLKENMKNLRIEKSLNKFINPEYSQTIKIFTSGNLEKVSIIASDLLKEAFSVEYKTID